MTRFVFLRVELLCFPHPGWVTGVCVSFGLLSLFVCTGGSGCSWIDLTSGVMELGDLMDHWRERAQHVVVGSLTIRGVFMFVES